MASGRGVGRGGRVVAVGFVAVLAACGQPSAPDGAGSSGAPVKRVAEPVEPVVDPVVERPSPDSGQVEELVGGLNDVGLRVFDVAARETTDDLVLSPLSIGLAFGMADAGASGATAQALEALFDYPVAGEERWSAFNTLEQQVSSEDGPIVRLANRQFPDVSFATADGYDELLGRWFGAGIEPLPLQEESDTSRERINGWVEERTEGLIDDLLPDGFLDPNSVMVLVNALYLEADWALPFGEVVPGSVELVVGVLHR